MRSPYDVVIRPVLTEKSYDGFSDKRYTFIVAPDSNKTEIKLAIEAIFGVKVAKVNTMNNEGKLTRRGNIVGRKPATKKAYVTLKEDSKPIEFFEGMAQ
ncbi:MULTISPECIES: 50S ribosomal protein L23 [unclassified Clostridium]|jgi:large subunit ribosomal protein L23|uniref:50S ribosomal protein L23 n=1 Tax=Clostridia TaxID=186801 RepID=UPI001106BCFF|nr:MULTISPECIES: 50S ribosomal protein L23 [unclassified Clostridium]